MQWETRQEPTAVRQRWGWLAPVRSPRASELATDASRSPEPAAILVSEPRAVYHRRGDSVPARRNLPSTWRQLSSLKGPLLRRSPSRTHRPGVQPQQAHLSPHVETRPYCRGPPVRLPRTHRARRRPLAQWGAPKRVRYTRVMRGCTWVAGWIWEAIRRVERNGRPFTTTTT